MERCAGQAVPSLQFTAGEYIDIGGPIPYPDDAHSIIGERRCMRNSRPPPVGNLVDQWKRVVPCGTWSQLGCHVEGSNVWK